MAATDKPFRDQRILDIVFAVSNILMLLALIWMFWQDYAREYKVEQRDFRYVEVAIAETQALDQLPQDAELQKQFMDSLKKVKEAKEYKETETNIEIVKKARSALISLKPKKERTEAAFQTVNAEVDSKTSFLNIALENNDTEKAKNYRAILDGLYPQLEDARKERDAVVDQIKLEQFKVDDIEGPYTKATVELKKVNDKLDAQVKLALTKRWTIYDSIRAFPVLDGFASPIKIQQFTLNDIPIDYNFKYVTRYDRCMTCHLGIDRPAYTRANLIALTKENPDVQAKLEAAKKIYDIRAGKGTEGQDKDKKPLLEFRDIEKIPNPYDLRAASVKDTLTPARVTQFAAHPRLDLFVGANSKHPAERFGCSSCHYGQGSGTTFLDASHSPNNSTTREEWTKDRGWESAHMWDFPMLPHRFVESSCIKCHHEVTDLVSADNRTEAPKLMRGYNLIKENGCFGCHEISGWKGVNRVGPDLRVEPSPPLDDLLPIERVKAENDPDNRPGTMRKVGPALTRVSEKVSQAWMEKWIKSPSSFRPDTKMPHYYGLSTNSDDFLKKKNAPDQEKFPNTEIASIAHFLMTTSKDYLKAAEEQHAKDAKNPQLRAEDELRLMNLLNLARMSKEEQEEYKKLKATRMLRKEVKLVDLAPNYKGNAETGRVLFTEKGCLACHTHQGTEVVQGNKNKLDTFAPAISSEAVFGPNLSQVAEKLTLGRTPEEARTWLIQWIVNPHVHSPRSRMPVTHLTPHESADVSAWLLSQNAESAVGESWKATEVTPPEMKDLKELAKVYLTRMLSKRDMDKFLEGMSADELAKYRKDPTKSENVSDEWRLILTDVADDEKALVRNDVKDPDSLKFYLGKKAVNRLGCYGCHDIPGFETAKSIGVGLNDWGKKPADRLAFEDIHNFFDKHYYAVDSLTDKDGKALHGDKDGKQPYEKFYADALLSHNPERLGYLNQKVRDPRSYDFNRIRAWDDRARMPQFSFARPRKKAGESDDEFKKRTFVDEAQAREAVATFVLGLVAEQVPVKSINVPKGDRLAEVKGRQVLDKYNCGGCHLIRPGLYELKRNDKTLEQLTQAFEAATKLQKTSGEIIYPNHRNWVGRLQANPERWLTFGSQAFYFKDNNDEYMVLRRGEALQFTDKDGSIKNIPAGIQVFAPLQEVHGKVAGVQTQADLDRAFDTQRPYGGAFTDLMVKWLPERNTKYKQIEFGDSDDARAALPPPLIGEGEKVQAEWLYQFLLDPHKVRPMTVLRMPKFNMSKDEARILTDYFASVTRVSNPGIAPPGVHNFVADRDDLDSPYWRKKTADYVAHLHSVDALDRDGKVVKKDGKAVKAFDQRVAQYKPLWEKMMEENKTSLDAKIKQLDDVIAAKEKALLTEKDKKADLQKEIDAFKEDKGALQKELKGQSVESLQKTWEEKEAYIADAYRMLTSRDLCTKCHQVGTIRAGEQDKQGPPLDLAHLRLRPEWVERWVDKPTRFVPYTSMTQYFNKDKDNYQQLYAAPASDQIHALSDVLAIYPRASAMPINRLHNPDLPADKK